MSSRGRPQALEHRWRGAVCPSDLLPTSAVAATAALTAQPGRALRAYMHAAFNARAVAALLAALLDAKATVLQDWHYAWSALHRDDAAVLVAELERLDAVNRGGLALPVEQPPPDAGGGPHIPVGQRVQVRSPPPPHACHATRAHLHRASRLLPARPGSSAGEPRGVAGAAPGWNKSA